MDMIRVRRAAVSTVHLAAPQLQERPSTELRTACGQALPLDEVEQLDDFGDDPCATCSGLHAEQPAAHRDPDRYAVALRGTRVRHLVSRDAARGELDGRPVVQTLCARLAWGPLTAGLEHWPLCEQCSHRSAAPG